MISAHTATNAEVLIWLTVGLMMMVAGAWTVKGVICKRLSRAIEHDIAALKAHINNCFPGLKWKSERDLDRKSGEEKTSLSINGEKIDFIVVTSTPKEKVADSLTLHFSRGVRSQYGFIAQDLVPEYDKNYEHAIQLADKQCAARYSLICLYGQAIPTTVKLEQLILKVLTAGANMVVSMHGRLGAEINLLNLHVLPSREQMVAVALGIQEVIQEVDRIWDENNRRISA